MPAAQQLSLGEFLSRHHGLKRSVISTTTTIISQIDSDYEDEWCMVAPQTSEHEMSVLSQRVNNLEGMTRQLLARIKQLEQTAHVSKLKTIDASAKPKQIKLRVSKMRKS